MFLTLIWHADYGITEKLMLLECGIYRIGKGMKRIASSRISRSLSTPCEYYFFKTPQDLPCPLYLFLLLPTYVVITWTLEILCHGIAALPEL